MPSRKLPPNKTLREMYESGMSPRDIAVKIGANVNTVASAVARIPGIKMRSVADAQRLSFARGRPPSCYWTGKKQPTEMVERRVSKIRGDRHWLWKGGRSRRPYRRVVVKRQCAKCGGRLNLCVHHIDMDHYNNEPENLAVLCVSCHLSIHKTMYWAAVRAGFDPPRSTGDSHWAKCYWRKWRDQHADAYRKKYAEWKASRKEVK